MGSVTTAHQIAVALRKERPRATQFALQIESFSENSTMARLRLCTGGRLDLPTYLAKTLVPTGHVEYGKERHALVLAELDVSTDEGKAVREIARELSRVSMKLRAAQNQIRRGRSPGALPPSEQNAIPEEAAFPPIPFDINLPVREVKVSFFAIAGDPETVMYDAPHDQYIASFRVLELSNCRLTFAPYTQFLERGQPTEICFPVDALHGTPLDQRYFGTILLQVALAEFTT
jgi:hypothetical protein